MSHLPTDDIHLPGQLCYQDKFTIDIPSYFENYNILDISRTFDKFDTYQWSEMFEDFY